MKTYLDLLNLIKETGEVRNIERTGYGTKEVFAQQIRFDLSKGFPILTTKKIPFRIVAEELFWFLSGNSSIKPLLEKNIHIWTSDALRHNLEETIKFGLITEEEINKAKKYAKEGNLNYANEILKKYENKVLEDEEFEKKAGRLGPVYGVQWRGKYGKEVPDQIKTLEDFLIKGPSSRRMLVSAWNPESLNSMALPPCHLLFQVNVSPQTNKLSLIWYQRSVDSVLGLPFNIASYALLTELLAKTHGYKSGEVIGVLGNTHIYLPHMRAVEEQLKRKPKKLPKLIFNNKRNSILDYTIEDIELKEYENHGPLKNPTPMFGGFF